MNLSTLKNPAVLISILLVFIVACGSSATVAPAPTTAPSTGGGSQAATAVPSSSGGATTAPAAPAATTAPAPSGAVATALPTAAPIAVPSVNPVTASAYSNAKYGGTLRWAVYPDSAHFDLAQNTSVVNSTFQMMLYNGILRYNPNDAGNTIIGDLAESWDISEDGKTWTFPFREGVKFTDGAVLTADDVVATWARIFDPPVGVNMPRGAIYNAYDPSVRAVDPLTVEFNFEKAPPKGVMLNGFALEWHGIFQKATLDKYDNDLKRDGKEVPTTGAFKFESYLVGEVWKNERNPDYWNDGLPFLDAVWLFPTSNSATRSATLLANQVDFAQTITPAVADRLIDEGEMTVERFSSYSFGATWFNISRPPFDNVKLRKAMRLAIDPVLIRDAILDFLFTYEGGTGWTFQDQKFDISADEKAAMLINNREEAVAEAKRLMEEVRAELSPDLLDKLDGADYLVRQSNAQYEVMAQISQSSWKTELGFEVKLRVVPSAQWLEEARDHSFDLAVGATASPFIDPSAYWNIWYRADSSENFGLWSNPEWEALMDQIDVELDQTTRYNLVRQAADILENDPPLIEQFYNRTLAAWGANVKGFTGKKGALVHNLARFDTVWFDPVPSN